MQKQQSMSRNFFGEIVEYVRLLVDCERCMKQQSMSRNLQATRHVEVCDLERDVETTINE